jgi:hypothetical protein
VLRWAALLAVAALAGGSPAEAQPATYGARLGAHSMLYLNSTAAQQEAVFRAASVAGLRYLRMDLAVGNVFRWDGTDFSAVDRIGELAARYRMRVLGTITETPWHIAGCAGVPFELLGRCAPAREHEATWRDMVFEVVRRARDIRHWELGNEPDDPRTFIGSAGDYARWASLAVDGIRAARPDARIAIGGFSRLDREYIGDVLHDPANPLIGRFDIANVHVRVPLRSLSAAARRAKAFYRRMGFDGRLWVTEAGYPSLPAHQWDPAMTGGDADQVRWMARGPRQLIAGGADAVFVSFRDNHEFGPDSTFGSEGVMTWPDAAVKPAFWALLILAATPLP